MTDALDRLLDQYDNGLLNRRQLLRGLALVAGGALTAAVPTNVRAQGTAILPMQMINHVNISTSDVKRSAEFYRTVFGAKTQREGPTSQLMSFPGATESRGCWISIGAGGARPEYDDADGTPGRYTHVGFGVNADPADYPRICAEIRERFPGLKPPNVPEMTNHPVGPYEAYLFDPDGIAIQLIPVAFDAANLKRG